MKTLSLMIVFLSIQFISLAQETTIYLNSQAEVDAFTLTEVSGNLYIQGPGIVSLAPLADLTSVGGDMEIYSNYDLTSLTGLSALTSIGGDMEITGNPVLTSLTGLSALTSVGGSLEIWLNEALTDINGLPNLTSVGVKLNIRNNNNMTSLTGLSALTSVGTELKIENNSALVDIDGLSSLNSIRILVISNNDALTNIDGLSGLTTVEARLEILNNDQLTNINGLSNLTSAIGLKIEYNPALENLDGLSGLISVWGLEIENNATLSDITGLSSLQGEARYLYINGNDALANVNGLEGLTSMYALNIQRNSTLTDVDGLTNLSILGGSLWISGNPNLTNIEGLAGLTSIGHAASKPEYALLIIQNNDALTNIDGLANVTSVHGGKLWINYNPTLTNINGLANITGTIGDIRIGWNPVLTNIDGLSGLISVGGLTIEHNDALTNLGGLEKVTSLGYLEISGNAALTNLGGLENLTSTNSLRISGNDVLPNVDELANLTSVSGSLEIMYNLALTNLDGLANSKGSLYDLRIRSNPALTNINGLANITSVYKTLEIVDNDVLANIDGLISLTSVGGEVWIGGLEGWVDGNPALTNLDGLRNLTSVGANSNQWSDVFGDLKINMNESLCECSLGLYPILSSNGVVGKVTIEDNAVTGGCNSKDEILANPPPNQPPTINSGGPYNADEGSSIQVSAIGSDPNGDPLDFAWDLNNDGIFENLGQNVMFSAENLDGPGTYQVSVKVSDGMSDVIASTVVNVINVPPSIGQIFAPVDPVQAGLEVTVSANFTDPCATDEFSAKWYWGDESSSDGEITFDNGSGTVMGSHTYENVGVFTLTLEVTDDDGGFVTLIHQFVVVFNPTYGFVSGGGWIDSPTGAYAADPDLSGRANFGFVSRYQIGKTTPEGNTQFKFHTANFIFHSTNYEWLVISGPNAKFKGVGTINGEGEYWFMVTATDADLTDEIDEDKFRIKIKNGTGVVYDNQIGDDDEEEALYPISGGNIMIHTSPLEKRIENDELQTKVISFVGIPKEYILNQNYPNPFNPTTTIVYGLPEDASVVLKIYNVLGAEVMQFIEGHKTAGYHRVSFNASELPSGIYFYTLHAGSFIETKKMILIK